MYWKDIGFLCREIERTDELGKPYKEFDGKEVYCNVKGIKRSEFYQANAQGYRPELCVELKECDYNREGHFEFNGVMYRVIRTYPIKNECVELICQTLVLNDQIGGCR